ncbi:hypothetical protein [Pseudalkalibacillus hwajinpoensis]|uniref:Holin n=1 Tax=Guptibacillus hwajinpoensis TaxID=208199 RepID=A0A4U1MJW8_9BACL|nr:hypothetical protein [Pseudalkalibacillus hwajinpoensis]TKD71031.1 hypothetical protein FBF83_10565 [Pseudalkalibacillus hwajinpoensis]
MDITVDGIALLPVIIGVVQLFKIMGFPTRFLPVLSIVIGIVLSYIYVDPEDFKKAFLIGLWLGLSATGMHSGFKNTMIGVSNKEQKTIDDTNKPVRKP